jgi:3-hydroxyisobutyrate dehydrogenase-like beta-hydroxyacid dehydrogenase
MTRIGFVGAGRMGAPMVRRLVGAGYEVRALARSADQQAALSEMGAQACSTVAEVADSHAVFVCVFTDEQVREVCIDGPLLIHMRSGATLVVHTTGSPRTAEALADRAVAHGVAVVDAAVSGGPHDIAAGTLTVFAGGDGEALDRVRPAIASYADPILHVGALGNGQRVKLINNALFAAQIGLVAEAVRLGDQLGVPETALLHALPHASGASRALSGIAARGSVAAFAAAVSSFVSKDVSVVRKVAAELGGDLGVLEAAIEAAQRE